MDLYQWISLLGVPSLVGTVFAYFVKQNRAMKLGLQALLRAQLIRDYNYYREKGYAPIYARENFENCWVQYEALGKNGVMKDIHDKFLDLPVEKQETTQK